MSNDMWGGRFSSKPDEIMEKINASIDFDKRLYAQDIQGSIAHAQMLEQVGILCAKDSADIQRGLAQIAEEIVHNKFTFSRALEDIHMNIESRLHALIGDAAGRLHTARSRNDQVATDFKLYVRDVADHLDSQLLALQEQLVAQAEIHFDSVMPGFTHLQSAQPVTVGHHLMAYVEMFGRDRGRIQDARVRLNQSPLGAAALAGTSFPIDREQTARALNFDGPTHNSLDSVSDRDFVLELLSAASICAVHLSRLSEELVVWSSAQFSFVLLSDKFTTGSSIMPQKRNPDAAELIRAKAGRIIGALNALMIVMKGLPLAYSKDMQEDKEQAFDAFSSLSLCLEAMVAMIGDIVFNKERLKQAAGNGFAVATDLADWLVRALNMPFRQAHHVTGRIVALAEEKGVGLEDISLNDIRLVHSDITEDVLKVLNVDASVASRTSYGGTAPVNVKSQVKRWKDILKRDREYTERKEN